MIVNKLINKETFNSLMEMFGRQNIKVSDKVFNDQFVSFVAENVQHIFVDRIENFPVNLVFNGTPNWATEQINDSIDESISIVAKEYIKHHGKNPSGQGSWVFGIGSTDSADWFHYKGKFIDGKKKAILKAQDKEVTKIYVMESLSGENYDISYKINRDKKNYRVALISEGKEIHVSQGLTESIANLIGSRMTRDWLSEHVNFKVNPGEVFGMKGLIKEFREKYLKEDDDPNIGRTWMNRNGQEVKIDYLKNGKYYTLLDGKPFGGDIIPVDQLERTIKVDTSWYQHKLKTDKELADQQASELAAQQAKAEKYKSIGGNALQKGRTIKALEKQVRYKGNVISIKDLIDSKLADGWIVTDEDDGAVLEDPTGEYALTQKVLGKIGINYARQVLSQTNESLQEKDKPSETPYQEEDSTFESNGNFYDLNTIFELSQDLPVEDLDLSQVDWALDYDKVRLDDLKSAEERVNDADTSVPIIVFKDETQPENEEMVAVDGMHRIAKAKLDGDKTIPSKIITDEIMDQAFIPQEDEAVTEAKTYTQRAPYKVVKVKNQFGVTYYRVQDKSGTFLSAEYDDKKDADVLVKNLNDSSEIVINEEVKSFEVKYKSTDGDQTSEGTKIITAPDIGKARTRFQEDNKELKNLQIISVNEVH